MCDKKDAINKHTKSIAQLMKFAASNADLNNAEIYNELQTINSNVYTSVGYLIGMM